VDRPVGSSLQMPLSFIGAEFTLKEPIAVTEFKARSLLTKMDYMLFGTGWTKLLTVGAVCMPIFLWRPFVVCTSTDMLGLMIVAL